MCGIAGVVRFDRPVEDERDTARKLAAALAHRGPDGEGCFRGGDGRALLVHRRLAIIDPSPRAAQPMSTADGRFHLVYNGEAYNYGELRHRLEQHGVTCRTRSDTEVVLQLLAHEGPAALARVRGMFALALWDDRERALLVARDRFGMKPLYLSSTPGRVAFASEIAALRRAGLASGDVSPAGILAFLGWASIPAPLTWVAGVEQLPPGQWRHWNRNGLVTDGCFADARAGFAGTAAVDAATLREQTSEALRDSVRAHLVADVPVGVFLSGGLDSGAIVSAARSASDAELHTCTVTVDDEVYSEANEARETARCFGTIHHELRVDAGNVARDFDGIVAALDQPTADAVNSYYVSRAVAATGIKAVLSGVGGDELFGGYPSFSRIPAALRVGRALGPLMRASGPVAASVLPAWRAAKWQQFAGAADAVGAYRSIRGFFMPAELAAMAGPALADGGVAAAAEAQLAAAESLALSADAPESPLAAVARMETCGFLRSQLLRDIDAVSMRHALEVRMPFVDHELQRVVWPALGSHPDLLRHKRLLRESLPQPLPNAVTAQPKRGFTLPFARWMAGPLAGPIRDGLHALADQRWITQHAADDVWTAWQRGDAHWSRPWGLGVLGCFLEQAR